jgi:hypothetical protein
MIPDECKMADLSDLGPPLKNTLLLLRTFVGDQGVSLREAMYRVNFVRLRQGYTRVQSGKVCHYHPD